MIELSNANNDAHRALFFFTILYLIVDYGRPQDIVPIGFLMPGVITILLLTAFLFFSGKISQTVSKQTTMLWLFILLLAAYIPFATNNYFAYKTTKDMLLFMPFILSTIICINSIERLKKIVYFLIYLAIYIEIYGILHKGLGSGNYFKDENDLVLYTNMWIPFCFFLFIIEKAKIKKLILASGLVLGIIVNIICLSRGGFIGLVCVGIIIWLFSPKKVMSSIVICLVVITFFFLVNNIVAPRVDKSATFWDEMSTISETNRGTAAERIESWKAGWRMFLDNPWGVGGNNYQVRFPEYQSDWFQKGMWGRVAHSLWFTLIPELGIIGVLIYGLLLFFNIRDISWLRKLKRSPDNDMKYVYYLSSAFIASFAGFFSSGTFLSVLYYPHYWYITALIVATRRIVEHKIGLNPR